MPLFPRVRVALGLFAATALACSSCSSDGTNPVTGKVLVNGQPAAGANVMFFPEGATKNAVPSTGRAGADGTFTLVTGGKPGAPAGKYIVTVTWPDPKIKPTQTQKMMGMTRTPRTCSGGSTPQGQVRPAGRGQAGENTLPRSRSSSPRPPRVLFPSFGVLPCPAPFVAGSR